MLIGRRRIASVAPEHPLVACADILPQDFLTLHCMKPDHFSAKAPQARVVCPGPAAVASARAARRAGQRGLTLIEVLVALAVVAILATLAAPNFISTINRARADAARDALESSIVEARTEAIRTGRPAVLSPNAGCGWSCGWTVSMRDQNNNLVVIKEVSSLNDVVVTPDQAGDYTVGARGHLRPITFTVEAGAGGSQGKGVLCVVAGGRLLSRKNVTTCS